MLHDSNFLGVFIDWSGIIAIGTTLAAIGWFFFTLWGTQQTNSKEIDQLYDDVTALRKDFTDEIKTLRQELTKIMYALGRLEGKLGVADSGDDDQRSGTS